MTANVKGIVTCIAAMLLFASQDAVTKHLTQFAPIPQILMVRFAAFAIFSLIYAYRRTGMRTALQTNYPWSQMLRGIIIVVEIGLFALTLRYLGIAETHAVFACFPLLVAALSHTVLGERVGWRRWVAIAVGFVGTLIILQPGVATFQPAALLAIGAAFLFAVYNIITRKTARDDRFETSLLYFGLVGLVVSALVGVFYWQPLDPINAGWMMVLAITGVGGHLLLIKALQLAPAVVLQPFNYFLLVWAIVIGYLVYGEQLDATMIMGALIVVGSGLFIAWRERALSRREPDTISRA